MEWTLAHPIHDVDDIMDMARDYFLREDSIVNKDENIFRKHLTTACTYQLFDKGKEFIAVCRDINNKLLGYCWYDRGGYTTYSIEEITNGKFHHVGLDLSPRLRIRLINEMIDQHILWAQRWGISLVCSTSIRAENDVFMKIHKKRGFTVHGSYAWIRTEKGIQCLIN